MGRPLPTAHFVIYTKLRSHVQFQPALPLRTAVPCACPRPCVGVCTILPLAGAVLVLHTHRAPKFALMGASPPPPTTNSAIRPRLTPTTVHAASQAGEHHSNEYKRVY